MFGIAWLTPLISKLIGGVAVAAVVLGGFLWLKTHYYNQGYAAAIAWVDEQNRKAIKDADADEKKRDDCLAAGGTWDNSRESGGMCSK